MSRSRIVFVALLLAVVLLPGSPATAVDQSKGYPGFCKDATGVTVVIDFGKLGGKPIVRCNPRKTRGTGLDALKGAGFQIAGAQRWGESFICRIENRPSAAEKLPIAGNEGYRETCVDTPPASGYWSYWHAGNNCAWEYSQWGVKNRDFIPGGFEGWSFALNSSMDAAPRPRIAAVRPGTKGGACNAPDQGRPTTNDLSERAPSSGASDPTGTTSSQPTEPAPNSADGELPPPKPREESTPTEPDDPSANVEFTGGESAPDVNRVLKEQAGGNTWAPWAAGGVVTLLVATMWWTARRRKHTREA